jgi:hypothetical protein
MSLPEISRRCLSCGAAVRAGSRFCQQCGKSLDAESVAAPEEREAARAEEWTPPTKEFAAFVQSPDVVEAQSSPAAPMPVADVDAGVEAEPLAPVVSATESGEESAQASEEAGRAGDLRGRVARVREGTRARVGRMRDEAIVVLEETPDDSGLRFVLAAAALFVVFVVLLFLSTTVLR